MIKLPVVNIIIPTYNQANVLGKAIESSLLQDYPNLRVIVSDDCSSDNTRDIVNAYAGKSPGKLEYIRNDVNLGRVGNYRKCLYDYADGEWIVNLDGDDYYTDSNFISHAIERILENSSKEVLFFQGSHIWLKGEKTNDYTFQIPEKEQVLKAKSYILDFYKRRYFSHMSTVYNRKLAIASGFYELDILSSDIYSFLKMCVEYPDRQVIISKRISGFWVQSNQNASNTKSIAVNADNIKMFGSLYQEMVNHGWGKVQSAKWASLAGARYIYSYLFC